MAQIGRAALEPWPRAVDENGRVYEGDVLALPLQAGGCVTLKQAGA